jgi:lysozyme family protein
MADAKILKPFILAHEGGYANVKGDKGGPTNRGITLATFQSVYGKAKTAADLKKLTDEQWENIFRKLFWEKCWGDQITNQSVANLLVDFAWHSGVATAVKRLQQVIGAEDDGVIGPKTITAMNRYAKGWWVMFDQLKVKRISYLNGIVKKNPSQKKFLKGWLNRVANIRYGVLVYGDKEHKFV